MNSGSHETALRTVGQALELLNVRSFSLDLSDESYVVEGSGFSGLQFSQEKLSQLEEQARARRSNSNPGPDPHSLSQMLRTVGAYADQKQHRLLKVSWCDGRVVISYGQPRGGEKTEELTKINLYDLWVHLYKLRGKAARIQKNSNRLAV
jgi:hypothetical protein